MIELWMLCFYLAGLTALGCAAFLVMGLIGHVFHDRLERMVERLVRD